MSYYRHTRRALALAVAACVGSAAHAAPTMIGADTRAAYAARVNFEATQNEPEFAQFIVYYKSDSKLEREPSTRQREFARAASARGALYALEDVRPLAAGGRVVRLHDGRGKAFGVDPYEAEALMVELARNPDVEYVEPDIRLHATFTPNDPLYPNQWHYFSPTAGINMAGGWQYATGAGVTVAVIDTGITPHSDLDANVVGGYDFISDAATARDGDGRDANPNDEGDWWINSECGPNAPVSQNSSWHGTHVAGILGAVTNNNNAVAGVAYNAKIVPVRVLGKCGGSLSDISDAVVWASGGAVAGVPANPNPAKVINMSLGGTSPCGLGMKNAINAAHAAGTVVVVAAGNDAKNVSTATPANCDNVIAVAALTNQAKLASFSNFGDKVDVAAPGVGILSLLNAGAHDQAGETTGQYSGTSQATPQVAGLAALILSKVATTPDQVESWIKCQANAGVVCAFDPTKSCGWGEIDTLRTMKMVAANNTQCVGLVQNPLLQPSLFTNDNNYTIPASGSVTSPNTVWGRIGAAPGSVTVTLKLVSRVIISVKDLKVDVIAPDNTTYTIFNHGLSLPTTFNVPLSSDATNGLWKLKVTNSLGTINGAIDTWSIHF